MSLSGLVRRSVARFQSDGPRGFAQLVARRYWEPFSRHLLSGSSDRDFVVGNDFAVSAPAFSRAELDRLLADFQRMAQSNSALSAVDIRIALLDTGQTPLPTPPPGLRVQISRLHTSRLVLSYVLWYGHVYLPEYLDFQRLAELKQTLQRLGVEPLSSVQQVGERYAARLNLKIRGPSKHTQFLYTSLRERLGGNHYGYREPIDLAVVAELPRKFEYLNKHAQINYVPIRDLNRYPGRVSRQYAVGEMYREPYLQTRGVLDVGCDIRGISENVGPQTRYVGVDIQGLADICIDLDNQELPFEPGSFDTVLCFEVLEHLNKIHQAFDRMLTIADRYFIGSLFIESGVYGGRSVTRFGEPLGNMHLPIAPVFDRHEWIFSLTDALDFIYYRARRLGFHIRRLDVFYDDARAMPFQLQRLQRAMKTGNIRFLSKSVEMVGFVLERAR